MSSFFILWGERARERRKNQTQTKMN